MLRSLFFLLIAFTVSVSSAWADPVGAWPVDDVVAVSVELEPVWHLATTEGPVPDQAHAHPTSSPAPDLPMVWPNEHVRRVAWRGVHRKV